MSSQIDKKPPPITILSNGDVTTAKPQTRLLKIPILNVSLIEPLIDIIADYTSDDRDLLIVIGTIILDFQYAAPPQDDCRVVQLFHLCHEIGHMEWMVLKEAPCPPRWWFLGYWRGPTPQSNLSYMQLSNIDWFKSVWWTLKRNIWRLSNEFRLVSWPDVKLEWARDNDARFHHCGLCPLFVAHKPSDTFDPHDQEPGCHRWSEGSSWIGPSLLPQEKHTHYQCAKCMEHFIHFYELVPAISDAIRLFGISDRCPNLS